MTVPSRVPDQLRATIQAMAKPAVAAMNGRYDGLVDTAVGMAGSSIKWTPIAAQRTAIRSVTKSRRAYRWIQLRRVDRTGSVGLVQSPGLNPSLFSATDSVRRSWSRPLDRLASGAPERLVSR